ncbi:MAG TPA: GNAT family N-acetyltransferase [Tepidisphaeraceae bacterium]|jgi:ribosomal protein S18 acetylase RimI-like enzyme
MTLDQLIIRPASLQEILGLRHRILRAGLPIESANFPADEAETNLHVGAFDGGGNVGCASFMLNEFESEPAWQLRGMATEDGYRGLGIGRSMLELAEGLLNKRRIAKLMWCNARVLAMGFYRKMGWEVVSEQFDIPTAGPHVRMRKNLPSDS